MKKILLTGGGTAGHAWPVVVIGNILKKNARVSILYVGGRQGIEKDLAFNNELPYKGVFVGKRRNYLSFSNIIDVFKICLGLIQVYFLFKSFKPDIVFAKGGYVTLPVVYWAGKMKIPLIIHESDVVMGKANIYASKHAAKICINFPLDIFQKHNPELRVELDKFIYTGLPLRSEFFVGGDFGQSKPSILITGGSQGSSKINMAILGILPELVKKYAVYHISGVRDFAELKKFENVNYHLMSFADEIADIMKKSDLIVTRSGANTLAEISALEKCAILVPLESAAKDHQNANAKIYEGKNAAVLISEKNLTGGSLLSIINRLMEDEKLRQLIGHHAGEFKKEDSAAQIVELLFKDYQYKER